jgi:hypothetical protein
VEPVTPDLDPAVAAVFSSSSECRPVRRRTPIDATLPNDVVPGFTAAARLSTSEVPSTPGHDPRR